MSSSPLVSIIMIFFDSEAFIEEAITSVFAQSYPNWELLLVDDGSSDQSTEIALRYVQQFPDQVRYFEHENHQNRGMSATRNLGIRNAQGKYIALLDSDDVWLPRKLEQQVAILESHSDAAMVYGASLKWYSWTGTAEDIDRDHFYDLGIEPNRLIKPPDLLYLILQKKASAPCTCSVLIRRESVEHVGGFEDRFRGMYEDQVFYAKFLLDQSVYVSDQYWDKYRKHPDSCVASAKETGKVEAAHILFLGWLAQYLTAKNAQHTPVWRSLQRQLRVYRYPFLHRFSKRTYKLTKTIPLWLKKILNQLLKTLPLKSLSHIP